MMEVADNRWEDVVKRNAEADGRFFYAVASTGIYCRPSCPSRRPRREFVKFFETPDSAENAGFRPCKRCKPDQPARSHPAAELIARVCAFIAQSETEPTLEVLSDKFGLSKFHLQRTFKEVVGVSPKQYATSYRRERFRALLHQSGSVTEAAFAAGHQSLSNAYRGGKLGITPAQYRKQTASDVRFAVGLSVVGALGIATTESGVCRIILESDIYTARQKLLQDYPSATEDVEHPQLSAALTELASYAEGKVIELTLPLDVKATAFQALVWKALQDIPYGQTRSYAEIAAEIGQPHAVRAVGTACAANPVAMAIPCHRVLRSDGGLSGYRWGIERKRSLLEIEKRNGPPHRA